MNALMQAPPFPTNPNVGDFYGNFVWNGRQWVCSPAAGVRVVTQVFTASGPYMPSPGLVTAAVELVGGGGAGGNAQMAYTGTLYEFGQSGGGGGAGAWARGTFPASLVAGGVQVTIGAGGVPAATATAQSGSGQASSFGALVVANGGMGGFANVNTGNDSGGIIQTGGFGQAGAGGPIASGAGDFIAPGSPGVQGVTQIKLASEGVYDSFGIATGGNGRFGGAPWTGIGEAGGGAQVIHLNGPNAAANTGAGGAGALAQGGAGSGAGGIGFGGNGGSGMCVVTEYCWADTAPDGDCTNPPLNVNARVAVTHVPWQGPGPCPPGWGAQQSMGFDEGD